MTLRAWRCGLVASVLVALALLGVTGGSGSSVQGQPDCTVTVKPGESIQRAIDAAQEGAVICLAAGTWEENLEIKKSLTLRGAGQEQTKIKGDITIASDKVIEVKLEGLTISENSRAGIVLGGSAQATIENNTIEENKRCGIWSSSDKLAQGKDNRMDNNGADLCGNLSASLRKPLEPQTEQKQLSFPGPYPTLQRAIDALAPGGTITIAAGEHQGGLTIWKPLTLRGVGREQVRIKGAVSLVSEAQGVQIEGVTVAGSAFEGR